MEDILSIDDEVLNEIYEYWPPPTPTDLRIPPLAWFDSEKWAMISSQWKK